jgi:hypothetical protein
MNRGVPPGWGAGMPKMDGGWVEKRRAELGADWVKNECCS